MWHPFYFAIFLILIWFIYAIFAYYIWYIKYGEDTHPFPWFLRFFGFYRQDENINDKFEYYKLIILYLLSQNGQLEGNNFSTLNWYYNNVMSNNAKNDQEEMESLLNMLSRQPQLSKNVDNSNVQLQQEILEKLKKLVPNDSNNNDNQKNNDNNNNSHKKATSTTKQIPKKIFK